MHVCIGIFCISDMKGFIFSMLNTVNQIGRIELYVATTIARISYEEKNFMMRRISMEEYLR